MSIILLVIAFIILCYVIFPRIYLRGKKLVKKSSKKENSSTVTFCVGKKEDKPKTVVVNTKEKSYKFELNKNEEFTKEAYDRAVKIVLAEETNIPLEELVYLNSLPECAYYVYNKRTHDYYKISWRQVQVRINQLYSYVRHQYEN